MGSCFLIPSFGMRIPDGVDDVSNPDGDDHIGIHVVIITKTICLLALCDVHE
jgi:hypothetical protein